jgi:hypothetical protein
VVSSITVLYHCVVTKLQTTPALLATVLCWVSAAACGEQAQEQPVCQPVGALVSLIDQSRWTYQLDASDETIVIPGPAAYTGVRLPAPRAYVQGVPVVVHIHNHGVNRWQIVNVSVGAD